MVIPYSPNLRRMPAWRGARTSPSCSGAPPMAFPPPGDPARVVKIARQHPSGSFFVGLAATRPGRDPDPPQLLRVVEVCRQLIDLVRTEVLAEHRLGEARDLALDHLLAPAGRRPAFEAVPPPLPAQV